MIIGRIQEGIFFVLLMLVAAVDVGAQQAGEQITIDKPALDDLYLAGRSIDVLSQVNGDLVSAGQRINVEQRVSEDVMAAAERVILRGDIGDDVRAVGRIVSISGAVGDDVAAAGETITLGPDATVGGKMWAAGRLVEISGRIEGILRAAGQSVVISGQVGDDVSIIAENIKILSTARIGGDLEYRSDNEAQIASGAVIQGTVQRKDMDQLDSPEASVLPVVVVFLLSTLLSLGVLYKLFPKLMRGAATDLRENPLGNLGLGLVVFLGAPTLALLLLVTVIGAPLGLAVLALYPVSLMVAWAVGIYLLSDLILRLLKRGPEINAAWRLLGVVIAIVVILVTLLIPFVGALVILFLLIGSLGAVARWLFRCYRNG